MDIENVFDFASLSKLAYESKDTICDLIKDVKFFEGPSTFCFVVLSKNKTIVVFRGTEKNFTDIAKDLDFRKVYEKDFCSFVHSGFNSAFSEVKESLFSLLSERKNIFITGHSLGGALAVLLSSFLYEKDVPFTKCIVYGCPRVFSIESAIVQDEKWAKEKLEQFINHRDLVPRLPPRIFNFGDSGKCNLLHGKKLLLDCSYKKRVIIFLKEIVIKDLVLLGFTWRTFFSFFYNSTRDHLISCYLKIIGFHRKDSNITQLL